MSTTEEQLNPEDEEAPDDDETPSTEEDEQTHDPGPVSDPPTDTPSEPPSESPSTSDEPQSNVPTENSDTPNTDSSDIPDDYQAAMNDSDFDQKKLTEMLNSYAKAFREEFEEKSKIEPENIEGYTRDFFRQNIHGAAAQVVWLCNNASSESVRLRAAETIIKEALADSRAEGDPIKEILKNLQTTGGPKLGIPAHKSHIKKPKPNPLP